MAIFGYNGSEWVHIGAIGNEFNSLSIANEFGAGNEFKSTSIFNDYGKYGSKYSSYSAFNEYATKPPIIVSSDYKFIAYLTINDYKTPGINTYEAVACAKNSLRSPDREMEDVTFDEIPGGEASSGSYTQNPTCPSNANAIGSQCYCNTGYKVVNNQCVLDTQFCPTNASLVGTSCQCNVGYTANGNVCVPTEPPANVGLSLSGESISCGGHTWSTKNICNPGYSPTCSPTGGVQCDAKSSPDQSGPPQQENFQPISVKNTNAVAINHLPASKINAGGSSNGENLNFATPTPKTDALSIEAENLQPTTSETSLVTEEKRLNFFQKIWRNILNWFK